MKEIQSTSYQKHAEIAQLVEHNLAKVGVASSSLVFRSKPKRSLYDTAIFGQTNIIKYNILERWRNW